MVFSAYWRVVLWTYIFVSLNSRAIGYPECCSRRLLCHHIFFPSLYKGGVPMFHVFANLYCLLFLSVLYGTLLYVWFVFFNSWYMKHLFMSLLMVFGEVSVQILAYYFNHVICHFITTFFLDSKCKSVRYLTYKYLDHSVLSLRNVFVSTWCMGAHTTMHMWRSEDKSVHLVLSFHFSVGWGHWTAGLQTWVASALPTEQFTAPSSPFLVTCFEV